MFKDIDIKFVAIEKNLMARLKEEINLQKYIYGILGSETVAVNKARCEYINYLNLLIKDVPGIFIDFGRESIKKDRDVLRYIIITLIKYKYSRIIDSFKERLCQIVINELINDNEE